MHMIIINLEWVFLDRIWKAIRMRNLNMYICFENYPRKKLI